MPRLARALIALIACITALQVPAAARADIASDATTYVASRIGDLTTKTSATDPLYYTTGEWHVGDTSCFRCLVAPAYASAVMATRVPAQSAYYRTLASDTVDRYLAMQNADGGYGDFAGDTSDAINTQFIAQSIGSTEAVLSANLPDATRRRWVAAIGRMAYYLVNTGTDSSAVGTYTD